MGINKEREKGQEKDEEVKMEDWKEYFMEVMGGNRKKSSKGRWEKKRGSGRSGRRFE